jgi:hypothetical protein
MILTKIYTKILYICDDCGRQEETDGELPSDPPPHGHMGYRLRWVARRGGQHLCPTCEVRRQGAEQAEREARRQGE